MKILFKVLALVFFGYFLWAASMNSNDLDALLWYGIYGVAAVASILFAINKLPRLVSKLLAAIFICLAIVFWPETFQGVTLGEGDIKNIEEGRESLGLLINATVMLLYWWRSKA